nr:MAG TPA: hypothetical protein [Caudoviricetes sp.]
MQAISCQNKTFHLLSSAIFVIDHRSLTAHRRNMPA